MIGLEVQFVGVLFVVQLQVVGVLQWNVVGQVVQVGFLYQFVEEVVYLVGVVVCFGGVFFVVVQFFDYLYGQVDVVFFEFEQCGWIVYQYVGIQYVDVFVLGYC